METIKLSEIKRELARTRTVTLALPNKFAFKDHDVYDFDAFLSFFNWDIHEAPVRIDLTNCRVANYQSLALLVLYAWRLKEQGCRVTFIESESALGASAMWRRMGARGLFSVLPNINQKFKGDPYKPLLAVRNTADFKSVISTAEKYTAGFNVEYMETLRYVLSELLYNTMEHGKIFGEKGLKHIRIPSIVQFTWYAKKNQIHFLIGDIGVGVKTHLRQAYPQLVTDEEAIQYSLRPRVSGTFGKNDPYKQQNNAGMGLYLSSNIIRRLRAEMHIISGHGVTHISPRDVTSRPLLGNWPGTFVLVTLDLSDDSNFELHRIMQDFRHAAEMEQHNADREESDTTFYLEINNIFGSYAEDKDAAIKFRDKYLFSSIEAGKQILINFDSVRSAPHSFLSALLASPIKVLGLLAYKKIRIVSATPEIRETLDFIFNDNTGEN
ncbi:MAG: DUF4325 domain-containing protein [Pseudoxanthomonas sp.]